LACYTLSGASHLPFWRTDGVIMALLIHAGPVEFLYYWLHRALHHHFLYSRYHSHHHSSIVTEPITCESFMPLIALACKIQCWPTTISSLHSAIYCCLCCHRNTDCIMSILSSWNGPHARFADGNVSVENKCRVVIGSVYS